MRSLFVVPGVPSGYKWWRVELRFDEKLNARQIRALEAAVFFDANNDIGEDGIVADQWPAKWPGSDDQERILHAIRKVGLPARIRSAPFGRDCPGMSCTFSGGSAGHRCAPGNAEACAPVFTDADWIQVDPHQVEAGSS